MEKYNLVLHLLFTTHLRNSKMVNMPITHPNIIHLYIKLPQSLRNNHAHGHWKLSKRIVVIQFPAWSRSRIWIYKFIFLSLNLCIKYRPCIERDMSMVEREKTRDMTIKYFFKYHTHCVIVFTPLSKNFHFVFSLLVFWLVVMHVMLSVRNFHKLLMQFALSLSQKV